MQSKIQLKLVSSILNPSFYQTVVKCKVTGTRQFAVCCLLRAIIQQRKVMKRLHLIYIHFKFDLNHVSILHRFPLPVHFVTLILIDLFFALYQFILIQ